MSCWVMAGPLFACDESDEDEDAVKVEDRDDSGVESVTDGAPGGNGAGRPACVWLHVSGETAGTARGAPSARGMCMSRMSARSDA